MSCKPIDVVSDQEVIIHISEGGLLRHTLGIAAWYLVADPKEPIGGRKADPELVARLLKSAALVYINVYQDVDDLVGQPAQKVRYNPNGKLLVILNDDNSDDARWQEDYWQKCCCYL